MTRSFEGFALSGGERMQLTRQRTARGQTLVDLGESIVGGQVKRQAESRTGPRLDLVPPDAVCENVAGDTEQPWQCGAMVLVTEAVKAQQGTRERLGSQVRSCPREPPRQPGVHVADTPHVELGEERRIPPRTQDEFSVSQ